MNWQGTRSSLKHLGTLHGTGDLLIENGSRNLGPVIYEIDGYARRALRSDNGRIEGSAEMLSRAYKAGEASIILADGQSVDVVLSNPRGNPLTDVMIKSRFPQFNHAT